MKGISDLRFGDLGWIRRLRERFSGERGKEQKAKGQADRV